MTEALDEKLLLYVANTKKIGLLDAALILDNCIRHVSTTLNIEYSTVYSTVFAEKCLASLLKSDSDCSKLSMDECIKSCNCFVLEPYGCISRYIKDADKINEDPDKYVKEYLSDTKALEKMVKIASYLYHNFSGGGIDDNAFNALEYHLNKRLKLKGRQYEKIGALPVEKLRVNLKYPLPSLNKAKPNSPLLIDFLKNFSNNKPIIPRCLVTLKIDGVSCEAVYKNYKLKSLFTRGDGIIGGNVSYLKDYIKMGLPSKISNISNLIVRGELVLSKENWERKYKGSYSNPRAFVSAKVNSGFISSALQDVEFIAYEIMVIDDKETVPVPSQALKILADLGFNSVDNLLSTSPTTFELMQLYIKKRLEAPYMIDGLVLTIDKERDAILPFSKGGQLKNPNYSIAFKMQLEEQIRSSKIINVEWNISRYGKYIPVAIFESVYIDGVRLRRATGHNAKHIQDWNMGKGTLVKVVRSGDVIPQIKDVIVDPSITPIFPIVTNEKYAYRWEKADIVLNDIENNREVKIKRIIHFFETIQVPRLREKTIEKLFENGYNTAESIVKMSEHDFMKIKGIGKKSAEFFYKHIRERIISVPPDRFIEASTTFKSGIGRKILKQLFKEIPNILNLNEDEIINTFKKHPVKGFGKARIENISTNIPKFRKYLDTFAAKEIQLSIDAYVEKMKLLKEGKVNKLINGKKFVLTGFGFMGVDYELEDYIYDNGGDFLSSVISDIEAVITGNVTEISKKMSAAYELKIAVLSVQEFSDRYGVSLKRNSYEFRV